MRHAVTIVVTHSCAASNLAGGTHRWHYFRHYGTTLSMRLAGRKESAEPQIHNAGLHRLYRKVDQLSDQDQQALVIVLDSLVKRSRVKRVMGA